MKVLILMLLCASGSAGEVFPDPLEQARDLYERGTDAYAHQRYEEALLAFEQAYASSKLPNLLFNIAVCHEKLQHWQAAVENLRRYLATEDVKDRPTVERKLAEDEERLKLPQAVPPVPPRSRVEPLRKAVIGGGVSAAALGLTAGALSIAASASYRDLAERCPLGAAGCSLDQRDHQRRLNGAADAMWGIAAAAAVTTVVLHLVLRHERRKVAAR